MTKFKTPIRVIFLDIEGVMATHRVQFSRFERGELVDYDPVVVDFLDSVCSKYVCYIVITSSLRKSAADKDWFKSKMAQAGGGMLTDFLFCDDELWKTTDASMECKALEIDDWFDAFKNKYGERACVENYVVIDDNKLGSLSMHDKHFVMVKDRFDGMGVEEFRRVVKILERD